MVRCFLQFQGGLHFEPLIFFLSRPFAPVKPSYSLLPEHPIYPLPALCYHFIFIFDLLLYFIFYFLFCQFDFPGGTSLTVVQVFAVSREAVRSSSAEPCSFPARTERVVSVFEYLMHFVPGFGDLCATLSPTRNNCLFSLFSLYLEPHKTLHTKLSQ